MLNTLDWIYTKIATYLKVNKWVYIFGDSMRMIGGVVVCIGLYDYINNDKFLTNGLLLGIMMIIVGVYIKAKALKDCK